MPRALDTRTCPSSDSVRKQYGPILDTHTRGNCKRSINVLARAISSTQKTDALTYSAISVAKRRLNKQGLTQVRKGANNPRGHLGHFPINVPRRKPSLQVGYPVPGGPGRSTRARWRRVTRAPKGRTPTSNSPGSRERRSNTLV